MKKVSRFLREYKLFSLTTAAIVIGLALQLMGFGTAAQWLLSIVAIITALPLLWEMFEDVRSGRYGIDILAITAIVAAVILGEYWAAIVVALMLTGGESLEDYAQHRARSELDALLKNAPQTAQVIRKGKTLKVKVSELHVGDKILINAGDAVPADAVVLEGTASFDESSLTGESLPQSKTTGDQLLSGSINQDGSIQAKVTASAEDSQYQQIVKLVKSAANSQAPFVRLAERYSVPFTILAFSIAGGMWVLTGEPIRFLQVIIVATPCPLLLAAPIALISGMSRASNYGIIVKTGAAMERMAEAKAIAFDKTGTLTRGEFEVTGVVAASGHTKDEVLGLAASLEQGSNHVIGKAIVQSALDKKVKLTKAKHIKETAGKGLLTSLKGQEVVVGRLAFLEERGIEKPTNLKVGTTAKTTVYVAVNGEMIGAISLSDELREEAKSTIARLRDMGLKKILLITGDNSSAAKHVAKQLNLDEIHAEALPVDKLGVLDQTKDRPLIFVGDGVNDAPILTAADVGVALGAKGSTAASESADMVIMVDSVGRVATAYEIAKRTFSIARQSILIGIALSVGLMILFATGKFSPLTGAILQEVVDVFVIFNALRAHLVQPAD
ncbi:MAG: heavy metal translocating P-type ATPase [Candidatus Saccharimonadales bacterium]